MLDNCVCQLAKGNLIEGSRGVRSSLQVSEEEFLRGVRIVAGRSLLNVWREPTALLCLNPGFLLPELAQTDDQTAVWLPKVTKTIPICLEIEFEPRIQHLQNLIRDS